MVYVFHIFNYNQYSILIIHCNLKTVLSSKSDHRVIKIGTAKMDD